MKIVSYLDNDKINKPNTKDMAVFALEIERYTSKEQIIEQYPEVFHQGVGKLEGEYHIRLSKDVNPVQHTPRQVPVTLRDRLKETLDNLVQQHIITPITKPTPGLTLWSWYPRKMGHYEFALIQRTLTTPYNGNIINCQPLKTLQHVYMEPKYSSVWMCAVGFGMFHWMNNPHCLQHFTHHLANAVG